jgi:class 3 adenylate cyclase
MTAAMKELNHVFKTGLRLRIGIHSGAVMVRRRHRRRGQQPPSSSPSSSVRFCDNEGG